MALIDIHPHVVSTDSRRYPVAPIGGRQSDWSQERPVSYEQMIDALLASLNPGNHSLAVEIANLPGRIRGFGHVKERTIAAAKAQESLLLARFRHGTPVQSAAE